ncbi:MAG: hypothetical protein ABR612_14915, partial [Chromatocurvus sp.]
SSPALVAYFSFIVQNRRIEYIVYFFFCSRSAECMMAISVESSDSKRWGKKPEKQGAVPRENCNSQTIANHFSFHAIAHWNGSRATR